MPSRATLADGCQRTREVALVVGLALTMLTLGGRHDGGRLIYALAIAVATMATVARASLLGRSLWTPLGPLSVAIAGSACVAAQILPLTAGILSVMAPGHSELLPLWATDSTFGIWSTISLTPAESVEGLGVLLCHGLLFFVIGDWVSSEEDVSRVLAWIAGLGVFAAIVAMMQQFFPDEQYLWRYDFPLQRFDLGVKGPFSNRNHLAHFLIFGAAALAPLAFSQALPSRRGAKKPNGPSNGVVRIASLVALAVLLVMVLATQSRGGAAALAFATLTAALLSWWGGRLGLKDLIILAATGSVVLGGVSFFGYDEVTARLDDLVSGQVDELDADARRRLIWATNARAFTANPWFGHGAGSHRFVYPSYLDRSSYKEFTHAESGYLQIATENGVAGLLVIGAAMALCLRCVATGVHGAKTPRRILLWSVLGAGLAASFVHSIVDFVWYVPVLAAVAVAFASCAIRLGEIQAAEAAQAEERPRRERRDTDWFRGGLAVAASAFAVACLVAPAAGSLAWDRYLRTSKTIASLESRLFTSAPDHLDPHLNATIDETTRRSLESLRSVVTVDPLNARAHSRLAGRLMQQFERVAAQSDNPMSIDMIADTVRTGSFSSEAEIRDWLVRAFGESSRLLAEASAHSEAAVRLCPLQGEAYLQLASLSFLQSSNPPLEAYVEQAVRLRPFDGRVRFEAGRQIHLAGDVDTAFEHYRASIRLPGSHRQRLVAQLARVLPAHALVNELNPDCAATDFVLAAYRKVGKEADLVAIAEHAEAESVVEGETLSPQDAARRWRQVSIVNRSLGRYDKAIECATKACELSPNDFWIRHEIALAYFEAEAYDEADPHLRWCLARRPDLRYLQRSLHLSAKKQAALKLAQRTRPLTTPAPQHEQGAASDSEPQQTSTELR
ncbi:O-antigen ligase family protein [Botrimarina colliarenosi]|nr:O-antigen ligase family protein [Botrimarina colliarenosi]